MKSSLKMVQKGFTLIELVVVLVVIGILAAIAVPRYLDLSATANTTALTSSRAAIEAASAINYAAFATAGNIITGGTVSFSGAGASSCATVVPLLVQGGLANGYAASGTFPVGAAAPSSGSTVSCAFSGPGGSTTLNLIYTS